MANLRSLLTSAWLTLKGRPSLYAYLGSVALIWVIGILLMFHYVVSDLINLFDTFRLATDLNAGLIVQMEQELFNAVKLALPVLLIVLLYSIQVLIMFIHRLSVLEKSHDESILTSLKRTGRDFLPSVALSAVLIGLAWLISLVGAKVSAAFVFPMSAWLFGVIQWLLMLSLGSFCYWYLIAEKEAIFPALFASVGLFFQRFTHVLTGVGVVLAVHLVMFALVGIPVLMWQYIHWGVGLVFGVGVVGLYALVLTYLFVFWGKLFYSLHQA